MTDKKDDHEEEKKRLSALYNRLSWWGRAKLQSVALTSAYMGIVREDTKRNAWNLAWHGTLMLATSLLPGPNVAVCWVPTYLWAKAGLTPWAKDASKKLSDAFNEHALVEKYGSFIAHSGDKNDKPAVHTVPLFKKAMADYIHDVREIVTSIQNRIE